MKKSILALLLAGLLALVSCGGAPADDTSADTSGDDAATTPADEADTTEPVKELDNTVIHFGTPTIDGKLDDVYLDSFCFAEEPMKNMNYSAAGNDAAKQYMPNTEGKCYYLWDDDYLYYCAVIHDETICSRGEDWRMNEKWPWNDDGAEIYLWFSDEDCMAIHGDAHGIRAVMDVHIWGDNHSSSGEYRDIPDEDWGASIDKEGQNYTIEVRIPLPDYVKAGSRIGTLLEIDDRWAVGEGSDKMVGALFVMPRFPGHERLQVELAAKQ